jgi:hypothetical protein
MRSKSHSVPPTWRATVGVENGRHSLHRTEMCCVLSLMVDAEANTRTRVYPGSGCGAVRPAGCARALILARTGVLVVGGYK